MNWGSSKVEFMGAPGAVGIGGGGAGTMTGGLWMAEPGGTTTTGPGKGGSTREGSSSETGVEQPAISRETRETEASAHRRFMHNSLAPKPYAGAAPLCNGRAAPR
jgi:hypothetical protein